MAKKLKMNEEETDEETAFIDEKKEAEKKTIKPKKKIISAKKEKEHPTNQDSEESSTNNEETNKSPEEKQEQTRVEQLVNEPKETNAFLWIVAIATILIIFNQIQLTEINGMLGIKLQTGSSSTATNTNTPTTQAAGDTKTKISLEGESEILAPSLLAQGEAPVLQNYGTKIKKFPTISTQQKKDATGDSVQDAINTLVPTGTPFYGQEAGVSFDDPITAQRTWGNYENSIKLTDEQQQRWTKIVGSFTCDYCCGSPQRPTIITHCGCAHAKAWRGMAKWFLNKYGDKYTDLQIQGEMSKWKTLWYPGPTIQRVLAEQQAAGGNVGQAANLDNLPGMVGGC